MNTQEVARKCSAVNHDGHPCRAWAIRGTEPALCSAHAGRNVNAGAPMGNKNALRHGYYARHFTDVEIADFMWLTEHSLVGELVLARTMLNRLVEYVRYEEASVEEMATIMPLVFTGIRTIAHLVNQMPDNTIDWDVILDQLSEDLGMDL